MNWVSAMLFADDVINFAAEEGIFLMNQAVFTEVFCSCCHELAQGHINVAAHELDGHGRGLWPTASDAQAGGSESIQRFLRATGRSFSRDGSNPPAGLSPLLRAGKRLLHWGSSLRQ